MSERKKSWAEMTDRNSEWLTWPDLLEMNGERDITLRIERAIQGKIKQSNKRVVALHFAGVKKPLGLNATNAKVITSITGSDKPADWAEAKALITLYIGRDKDPTIPGAQCNCVRIRPRKPSEAQLFAAKYDHERWLTLIGEAASPEDVAAARELLNAQKPPKEHHAAIKAAIEAATARITAAMQAASADLPTAEATP